LSPLPTLFFLLCIFYHVLVFAWSKRHRHRSTQSPQINYHHPLFPAYLHFLFDFFREPCKRVDILLLPATSSSLLGLLLLVYTPQGKLGEVPGP